MEVVVKVSEERGCTGAGGVVRSTVCGMGERSEKGGGAGIEALTNGKTRMSGHMLIGSAVVGP